MNRFIIKLPSDINLFYCQKRNLLLLSNKLKKKLLKLKIKLLISKKKKMLKLTNFFFHNKFKKKDIVIYQKTVFLLIKNFVMRNTIKKKTLRLVGVGYKFFLVKKIFGTVLELKLGYSHNIYYKIPKNFKIIFLKNNLIILLSENYKQLTKVAAKIRSYKKPEPYKGKGILYENENIVLKQGKKI